MGKTKVFILDLERALLKKKPGGKNLEVGPEVGMAWYADAGKLKETKKRSEAWYSKWHPRFLDGTPSIRLAKVGPLQRGEGR